MGKKVAKFSGCAADLTKVFPMVLFTVSEASMMPSFSLVVDFDDDDGDDGDVMSRRLGRRNDVASSWGACIRRDDAP